MLGRIDAGTVETSITVPVQGWRLTAEPDVHIVLAGGEVPSDYARRVRDRYADGSVLFAGYANEVPGYIPTDQLLRTSGSYAGGFRLDCPTLATGSAMYYGWAGHLRGKPSPDAPDGVEQILNAALDELP